MAYAALRFEAGIARCQRNLRRERRDISGAGPDQCWSTCFLLVALLVTISSRTALGPVRFPFREVLQAFLHPSHAGDAGAIIFTLRLPRVFAAMLVGAALAVTGVLFQGLFRNPLADPFVLGTSGGAALGGAVGNLSRSHAVISPDSEPRRCWRFAVPSSP